MGSKKLLKKIIESQTRLNTFKYKKYEARGHRFQKGYSNEIEKKIK